jgi:hypothetical protein
MNEPVKQGTEFYELFEGDQITVGTTHEIKVGYDKSWVKYEAVTKIRPGERSEDARTRAIGHVNESVMRAVAQAVETVRRFNA